MHGRGKLITDKGDIFEGEFKNNKMSGSGILIRSNGEKYEGEFKDN